MNPFLGPLDGNRRIPLRQQTRVAAFLMSAHGAQARRLAATLAGGLHDAWQVEMHVQFCREMEILSLLARATCWVPDPKLALLLWRWETAWWPQSATGIDDRRVALLIDMAAFGHALHAGLRPAALLPEDARVDDAFTLALRWLELESGRLMQSQIVFLKGPQFRPIRDAVAAAVERRHAQVRELFTEMLIGVGVEQSGRHLVETSFQIALRTDSAYQASLRGALAAPQTAPGHADKANHADKTSVDKTGDAGQR